MEMLRGVPADARLNAVEVDASEAAFSKAPCAVRFLLDGREIAPARDEGRTHRRLVFGVPPGSRLNLVAVEVRGCVLSALDVHDTYL